VPDSLDCWYCHRPLEPGKPSAQVCPNCGHMSVYQPKTPDATAGSRTSPSSGLNVPSTAAVAGGVVGAVGLGLTGLLVGAATTREMLTDPSGGIHVLVCGTVGVVLGLPLGVAVGLHMAVRRLGIRGCFWPTLGGACCGLLIPLLVPILRWLIDRPPPVTTWVAAVLLSPLPSLIGELVAFQRCVRRQGEKRGHEA